MSIAVFIKAKPAVAGGMHSLSHVQKQNISDSPPQHYRPHQDPNSFDQPKSFTSFSANQYSERGLDRGGNYSKAELSSVQGYGTLPRKSKKSSSSSANSCVTAIQSVASV